MAKPNLPDTRPAPQIIHYVDPSTPAGGLQVLTAQELAARRRTDQVLYARWVVRRAELAERDRKLRRFWLGFGLIVGLTFLVSLGALVWFIAQAVASAGAALIAIPLIVLAVAGLTVGGHKCVTVVQHWH